jgi:hypothetical protein
MEHKIIRSFDFAYLNELLTRDKALLIGDYPKLNGMVRIFYTCICGNMANKRFNSISYYGGAFCKNCTKKNKVKKIKDTCLEKYGVDNPSYVEEIKEKKMDSYLEHYGMHPKKTKEVNDKYITTCLEKYGCINSAQADKVKEKIKNTFNEKYGGHPMFDSTVKNKVKKTCLKKYGSHPSQNELIKNKIKQTNLKKYGCHPSQTPDIMEKIIKSSKSYKKYTLPSGEERIIQGYEPYAINLLLKEYAEEEIITDRYKIPTILYKYNNETKYYFPDIYIPHKNLIIEVKSDWIYKKQLDRNIAKEEATRLLGYNYEIWFFNKKGEKIPSHIANPSAPTPESEAGGFH